MHDHHQTPQPWIREPAPWEPEPSAAGRAVIRQWLDHQFAVMAGRRRRWHWSRRHGGRP